MGKRSKKKKSKKIKSRKSSKKIKSKKSSKKIKFKKKKPRKFKSKTSFKKQVISKDDEGNTVIKVSERWSNQALVNKSKYQKKYNLSLKENDKFWKKEGKACL